MESEEEKNCLMGRYSREDQTQGLREESLEDLETEEERTDPRKGRMESGEEKNCLMGRYSREDQTQGLREESLED